MAPSTGPLRGVTVVELGGLGPGPIACMLLADMGADVVRVERVDTPVDRPVDVTLRGRRSLLLDLKNPGGQEVLRRLLRRADAMCEGFRPGVLERLGFAPEQCWRDNPRLVIGRVTGWGQDGPLAQRAGHDVNYLGLSGVLHSIGPRGGPPTVPINLVADGAGGLLMAFGVLCGLLEARERGTGQVVDSAMVDASALLMAKWYGDFATGSWVDKRGANRVDGGSHYYNVYETADGRYLSVGAIEQPFYLRLLVLLGLDAATLPDQHDRNAWPEMTERFAAIFRSRTQAEWLELLGDEDVCVGPVLGLAEAPAHPHARAREAFVEVDGVVQPAPAPRMADTASRPGPVPRPGAHTDEVLRELGYADADIDALHATGAVG